MRAAIGVASLVVLNLAVLLVAQFATGRESRTSRVLVATANILGGAFLASLLAAIAVAACATVAWVFNGAAA
jgi:hypothetical protein